MTNFDGRVYVVEFARAAVATAPATIGYINAGATYPCYLLGWSWGNESVDTGDEQIHIICQRISTDTTGTLVTPAPIREGDSAAVFTANEYLATEPTYDAEPQVGGGFIRNNKIGGHIWLPKKIPVIPGVAEGLGIKVVDTIAAHDIRCWMWVGEEH